MTLLVEVDLGSTSTRGRGLDHHWLVLLRNRSRHTVVAVGLTRPAAEHLAAQLRYVLSDPPTTDSQSEGAAMQ